jgi:Ca2+-binding RTX toxin-like protein
VRPEPAQAQPACTQLSRTLSNGAAGTDGALSVTVDGLGAFSSAIFNPPGPAGPAATTKSSALFAGGPVDSFLRDDCLNGQVTLISADPFVTELSIRGVTIRLTQTLAAISQRTSVLTQSYELSAVEAVSVPLVRHVDGDLLYDGTPLDGSAATPDGAELSEFDAGDAAPRETLLAITGALAGDPTPDAWTIQQFNYAPFISGAHQIPAGDNGQVGTQAADDATLSQQWNAQVPSTGSVSLTTVTRFGTPPNQHTLTVSKTGDGDVTSVPPGISCGPTCSAAFDEGTVVALTSTPNPGWSFAGWAGACSGTGACAVAMNGVRDVIAHFSPPPPTPAQNVNAIPIRGQVLVREPGSGRFVELTAADQLPIGTQIDTTNGTIQLTVARAGGVTDTTQFFDGLFTILQGGAAAIAELRLDGGDFTCLESASFSLAASKKPIRRLWGSGKGKYRTRGKYSSATVRGTRWKTEDRCDGTLTLVEDGIVGIRDFVRGADVTIRAGQSYLAAPLSRNASSAGCTLIGTPGKDTLRGTPKRDVLCGLGGADVLLGLGGNDKLYGGNGSDWLDGGNGNDLLNGGAGHDRLDGGIGRDYLAGGKDRDLLITRDGSRGNDRVIAGSRKDLCRTDAVRVCP